MLFFAFTQFHVFVQEPELPSPDASFVDNLIASFEHARVHWIEFLVSSLAAAVGFVGIAILGVALRRCLDREDSRGAVLAVTFLLAGAVGAASQVLSLGAGEVTTNPQYCDCGFLAEEIVSRATIDQVVNSVMFWMTDASVLLFAIGLWMSASMSAGSAWVPGGLTVYTRVLAVTALLTVIWDRIGVPLLDTGTTEIDFGLIGGLITLIFAGLLLPIWAIWLARAAGTPAEASEALA
jgi:hypothetical protein